MAEQELESHARYAYKLAGRIAVWAQAQGYRLQVRCFLMDLRDDVTLLEPAQ